MVRAYTLDLIQETPAARGIMDSPTETARTVYCTVRSVGMQEAYQAMAAGLNPEMKLVLAHHFEYQNERLCEFEGVRYKILRTYITEADGIELTVQRLEGNAGGGGPNV